MTDPTPAPARPDELRDFLLHLEKERDVSPHTLTAYARDLDGFVTYLSQQRGTEAFSWDGVDRLTMRGYLGFLTRKGLSKRSIARALSALRTFYRYLQREDVVDANPARAVGSPKLEKYLPGYLDRAQVDDVIMHVDDDQPAAVAQQVLRAVGWL